MAININETINDMLPPKNGNFMRPDFLFSYWIFLWGIIYIVLFRFFKEKNTYVSFFVRYCNPLLVFIFAFFENLWLLIKLFIQHVKPRTLFLFFVMMIFAKIIPIYLLLYSHIRWIPNIISILSFFIGYNIYLLANGTNIFDVYVKTNEFVIKEKTPFIYYMNRIFE